MKRWKKNLFFLYRRFGLGDFWNKWIDLFKLLGVLLFHHLFCLKLLVLNNNNFFRCVRHTHTHKIFLGFTLIHDSEWVKLCFKSWDRYNWYQGLSFGLVDLKWIMTHVKLFQDGMYLIRSQDRPIFSMEKELECWYSR
jgi:hypothetical protein